MKNLGSKIILILAVIASLGGTIFRCGNRIKAA